MSKKLINSWKSWVKEIERIDLAEQSLHIHSLFHCIKNELTKEEHFEELEESLKQSKKQKTNEQLEIEAYALKLPSGKI